MSDVTAETALVKSVVCKMGGLVDVSIEMSAESFADLVTTTQENVDTVMALWVSKKEYHQKPAQQELHEAYAFGQKAGFATAAAEAARELGEAEYEKGYKVGYDAGIFDSHLSPGNGMMGG
jgi:hypothetical protein